MRLSILLAASAAAVSLTCSAESHLEGIAAFEEVPLLEPNPLGGPACVELHLQDGARLLFALDTACPNTYLNQTSEPRLGKCVESTELHSLFYASQPARIYQTPAMYLGKTRLIMPRTVCAVDALASFTKYKQIVGVLGTDCLSNYCLQLDFPAKKVRLLRREEIQKTDLGKVFPMQARNRGWVIPIPSPIWGKASFLVDTGLCGDCDALLAPKIFRRSIERPKPLLLGQYTNTMGLTITNFAGTFKVGSNMRTNIIRVATFPVDFGSVTGTATAAQFSTAQLGEEAYTEIAFGEEPSTIRPAENLLGCRFFSRHVATFDFPGRCLYLKHVLARRTQ